MFSTKAEITGIINRSIKQQTAQKPRISCDYFVLHNTLED